MITSLANSQTPSNNNDLVLVPVKTLKTALLVKTERDYLKDQISVVRDSVYNLNKIIFYQDSIITNQDSSIKLYKKIDIDRQSQLSYKDDIITNYKQELKKEKKKSIFILGGSSIILLLTILI
jgi:hypothetical protein